MPKLKRKLPPIYVRIADHLRDRILGVSYIPTTKYSERQIAQVGRLADRRKALDILRREAWWSAAKGRARSWPSRPAPSRAGDRYLRSVETGRIYLLVSTPASWRPGLSGHRPTLPTPSACLWARRSCDAAV